ncbi:RING finger protein 121/175 [Nematocida sp. AWRm80]|nr:RING finger protein 121/175 [Nematocida sp. AWRm80]
MAMEHRADDYPESTKPIIVRNLKGITKQVAITDTEEGKIVQELIIVEVDSGDSAVISSLIALAIVFVGVQILAYVWKKAHKGSFQIVSTLTLLIFPMLTALITRAYMFITVWLIVILVHLVVFRDIFLGRRPKMLTTNIYEVYRSIFKVSICSSLIGYLMIAIGFFKGPTKLYSKGIILLMYSLYYTLIIRTGLDFISQRSAGTILPSKKTVSNGVCPLCREDKGGKKITLSCNETFHETCIKSWKILGKTDTCPSCKEKVDLSNVAMNPWQKNEYIFTKFLDFTSNLILAYAVTQGLVFFFNL